MHKRMKCHCQRNLTILGWVIDDLAHFPWKVLLLVCIFRQPVSICKWFWPNLQRAGAKTAISELPVEILTPPLDSAIPFPIWWAYGYSGDRSFGGYDLPAFLAIHVNSQKLLYFWGFWKSSDIAITQRPRFTKTVIIRRLHDVFSGFFFTVKFENYMHISISGLYENDLEHESRCALHWVEVGQFFRSRLITFLLLIRHVTLWPWLWTFWPWTFCGESAVTWSNSEPNFSEIE